MSPRPIRARRSSARLLLVSAFALSSGVLIAGCGRSAAQPTALATTSPTETVVPTPEPTVEPTPSLVPPTPTAEPPTVIPTAEPTEATASEPAAESAPTAQAQRMVRVQIPAPSLADNLVGEKAERPINVYLPASYATSEKEYPVIYYLPGFGDGDFLGFTPGADSDALVESGVITEAIFVSANGVNALGGSFYANSPVTGNWEDFVAEDLVSYVDANFRTLAQPESRGLAGHSMGGFGALNVGMHRPDVFGAVYSLSPGLFDPNGLAESQMFSNERAINAYLDMDAEMAALSPEDAAKEMTRQYGDLGFALAYGAAFAPNPERQPPVEYPYHREGETLVRDDAIWQRWEAGYGGIPARIAAYGENLKQLRGLVIEAGSLDNYAWIPKGVAYFGEQLDAAGIPNKVLTFEGGHQDKLRERWLEHVLPFFATTLVAQQ